MNKHLPGRAEPLTNRSEVLWPWPQTLSAWQVVALRAPDAGLWNHWLDCGPGDLHWHSGAASARVEAHVRWASASHGAAALAQGAKVWLHPSETGPARLVALRPRFGRDAVWRMAWLDDEGAPRAVWRLNDGTPAAVWQRFLTDQGGAGRPDEAVGPVAVQDAAPGNRSLHDDWLATRDCQEAARLHLRWGLDRLGLLQRADARFVQALDRSALPELLERSARAGIDLAAEMSHSGGSLVWQGPPRTQRVAGAALSATTGVVTWQVPAMAVASAWWVRHPTRWGLSSGIELFDDQRQLLLRLGLSAQDGRSASCPWRQLLAEAAEATPRH